MYIRRHSCVNRFIFLEKECMVLYFMINEQFLFYTFMQYTDGFNVFDLIVVKILKSHAINVEMKSCYTIWKPILLIFIGLP